MSEGGTSLRALLGWLRRGESLSSLSSVGSEASAASFAYQEPAPRLFSADNTISVSLASASCRRREREAFLRGLRERNSTTSLARKYGLPRAEVATLPAPRPRASSRVRRAASEAGPLPAHVPGKRKAPLPPRPLSLQVPSVPRNRKRRAPPPPRVYDLTAQPHSSLALTAHRSAVMDQPPNERKSDNRYGRVDSDFPEIKIRRERSFFRQIFENKKRPVSSDAAPRRILPNISELDKQATQIFESHKLKPTNNGGDAGSSDGSVRNAWVCPRCKLRSDGSRLTCPRCLSDTNTRLTELIANATRSAPQQAPETNISASGENVETDKNALKEILKQMKHSLPERKKIPDGNTLEEKRNTETNRFYEEISISETPTLRVGTKINEVPDPKVSRISSHNSNIKKHEGSVLSGDAPTPSCSSRAVICTQPVVLMDSKNVKAKEWKQSPHIDNTNKITQGSSKEPTNLINKYIPSNKEDLQTPLRISTLLNPLYTPKNVGLNADSRITSKQSESSLEASQINIKNCTSQLKHNSKIVSENSKSILTKKDDSQDQNKPTNVQETKRIEMIKPNDCNNILRNNQRRKLVNQLEESIAKGDEKSAADAAARLAQLRLSCSVLSYTPPIIPAPCTSFTPSAKVDNTNKDVQKKSTPIAYPNNIIKEKTGIEADIKQKRENSISINVWIEDKQTAQGPIQLVVTNSSTLGSLRQRAETSLGLPSQLQRWVVDRTLCDDDSVKLASIAGPLLNAPFYLCLVEAAEGSQASSSKILKSEPAITAKSIEKLTKEERSLNSNQDVLSSPKKNSERELFFKDNEQKQKPVTKVISETKQVKTQKVEKESQTTEYRVSGSKILISTQRKIENFINVQSSETTAKKRPELDNRNGEVYAELIKLEQQALCPNVEVFECGVCLEQCGVGAGVTLRECAHMFCIACLRETVRHCEDASVACPGTGCEGALQEREVRGLASAEELAQRQRRALRAAEQSARDAFHCRTPDCGGWALAPPDAALFACPLCRATNCLYCKAIHEGETCAEHREKLRRAGEADPCDANTRALLDELLRKGEALACPECGALLSKKWGCDYVRCAACKTEICWATRGRRWGKGGRGDTTGGCRCGVGGQRCHPTCSYCH